MKKPTYLTTLAFASFSVLAACGDAATDDVPEEPGGPSNPGDPDGTPRTVDAAGSYRLHSTFDIATNMPGTAGSFVNGLIEATNDPDDPMSWLLDQMLATMEPGTLKTILVNAKPFVTPYLNSQLQSLAPDLVDTVTEIGHRMAYMTKNFGLEERLVVISSDQQYVGQMTADGARFAIDATTTIDAPFYAHDLDNVVANGIHIGYENDRLSVGDHTLALPYGKLVRIGLDVAIIPAIDPAATGLADLLDNVVNCTGVGQAIADEVDIGSPAFWKSVCLAGLDRAADAVYDQLVAADSLLDFNLTGSARANDTNNDYKLDKLGFGEWAGTNKFEMTTVPLAQPATFNGNRE
jgi:hypothetical protein